MAKLRFGLGTWSKGVEINGKDEGTGFLVVELDNTVSVKNLFNTKFLFTLDDVKSVVLNKKDIQITTKGGDLVQLWAKSDDLGSLERLIKSHMKKDVA